MLPVVDCGNMVKGGCEMEPFIFQKMDFPFFSLDCWQDQFPHLVVGISAKNPEEDWHASNYAFHVGNNADRVLENRKHLTKQLHMPFDSWTCAEQVHGTRIKLVEAEDQGKGRSNQHSAIPSTDGLVTFENNLFLASFYADCVPLFFYSPDLDLVGVAHAGWKGTVQGMGHKMVNQMVQLGAQKEQIRVAIGPSIGMCCYEVDHHVIEPLKQKLKSPDQYKKVYVTTNQEDRYRVDLKQANVQILLQSGVLIEHIVQSKWCTSCQTELFHSHRRDQGDTGRMVAWIGKKGEDEAGASRSLEFH